MTRRLEVEVDKHVCIGNQMCIQHAPEVFSLDANGYSTVGDPTAAPEERVIAAARECPVAAISVIDADTRADLVD